MRARLAIAGATQRPQQGRVDEAARQRRRAQGRGDRGPQQRPGGNACVRIRVQKPHRTRTHQPERVVHDPGFRALHRNAVHSNRRPDHLDRQRVGTIGQIDHLERIRRLLTAGLQGRVLLTVHRELQRTAAACALIEELEPRQVPPDARFRGRTDHRHRAGTATCLHAAVHPPAAHQRHARRPGSLAQGKTTYRPRQLPRLSAGPSALTL